VPDDALLDAAANGHLSTGEQVAKEARRMLADAKARPAMQSFYEQWFGLRILATTVKNSTTYPAFTDALRDAMAEETRRYVLHVVLEDDARLGTLLSAPYSFVNGPLAEHYGLKAPADPSVFERTTLPTQERSGILTQGSVLTILARTDESSPVKRGKWIRTRLLCQPLPDPPNNIPSLPAVMTGVSNREALSAHSQNPACRSCHRLLDSVGFGLEGYDGIGGVRTNDNGVPVDAKGEITDTRDINGSYSGGPELAARLAKSTEVRDCAATQSVRYAIGRREVDEDACSVAGIREAFARAGADLRELMVAMTQTYVFSNYRRPE
jgi:hypothetical protein